MARESFHHASAAASYRSMSKCPRSSSCSRYSPIRLVAAEAGLLPPGPFTLFADMLAVWYRLALTERTTMSPKSNKTNRPRRELRRLRSSRLKLRTRLVPGWLDQRSSVPRELQEESLNRSCAGQIRHIIAVSINNPKWNPQTPDNQTTILSASMRLGDRELIH